MILDPEQGPDLDVPHLLQRIRELEKQRDRWKSKAQTARASRDLWKHRAMQWRHGKRTLPKADRPSTLPRR